MPRHLAQQWMTLSDLEWPFLVVIDIDNFSAVVKYIDDACVVGAVVLVQSYNGLSGICCVCRSQQELFSD